MNNRFIFFAILFINICLFIACSNPSSQTITLPSSTPKVTEIVSPVPGSTRISTTSIKPDSVYSPPADQFLPNLKEFPPYYDNETNISTENLSINKQLPLPKENLASASFRNLGLQSSLEPQNGTYYRFVYWVIIAPNELQAQFFFTMSQTKDYVHQAFLIVTPASIQQTMQDINQLSFKNSPCNQESISFYRSDPYASLRNSQQLPTRNPSGGYDPKRVINSPPDLYIYSVCRIKNVLVVFWGHAPDNFDGNNSPIPTMEIGRQVVQFWEKVIQKLK